MNQKNNDSSVNDFHKYIVDYFDVTENAYKDAWDLDNSQAMHYGYWDEKVTSFPQSLQRMNEVMATAANIQSNEIVLDAGCGVGGSSNFLASTIGCKVIGITLSEKQVALARKNAEQRGLHHNPEFQVMDFSNTSFPDESFDVVWGCESISYADNKELFLKEAFRLLKPGGRVVIADGFVTKFEHNQNPIIRRFLDGWHVNYLETLDQFSGFMKQSGFSDTQSSDITQFIIRSSRRLFRFYYPASAYLWLKETFTSRRFSEVEKNNIRALKAQYDGIKKYLWHYGILVGKKPHNVLNNQKSM